MDLETIARLIQAGSNRETLSEAFDREIPGLYYGDVVKTIWDYLRNPSIEQVGRFQIAEVDQPLVAILDTFRAVIDWNGSRVRPEAIRRSLVSPISDEILLKIMPHNWTGLFALNHILLGHIIPTRNTAVVVTMRNDGVRILEWVAHYIALGFEGIFVYSNDNDDLSDLLLQRLAERGIITFIRNDVSGQVSPQRKAFEHSVRLLPELRDFAWVFYADSDEFLIPSLNGSFEIQNFVANISQKFGANPPSSVCFNWKWFVSSWTFAQTYEPLVTRFQHSTSHTLIKSLVLLKDVLTMIPLHFPLTLPETFFVSSSLELIDLSRHEDKGKVWDWKEIDYNGGKINHYWARSFEEFLIKKRRGDLVNDPSYKRGLDNFFDWNGAEVRENFDPVPSDLLSIFWGRLYSLMINEDIADAYFIVRHAHPRLLSCFGTDEEISSLYTQLTASHNIPER